MLKIRDLHIAFSDGEAVHGISLDMAAGELLGLVGESGSGKTVTALTVAGLIGRGKTKTSGSVEFEGTELLSCSRDTLRSLQGKEIGMIFQEPMTSLDPTMRVGKQVEESLLLHTKLSPAERRALALEAMAAVELPENIIPVCLLDLGYPAADSAPSASHTSRLPLEDTVTVL